MTKNFDLTDIFKPIEMAQLEADPVQVARVREIIDDAGTRMKPKFRESFARRLVYEKVSDPQEIVRRANAHVVEYPVTAMQPGEFSASASQISRMSAAEKLALGNKLLAAKREAELKGKK
jgi:hypothetical protein